MSHFNNNKSSFTTSFITKLVELALLISDYAIPLLLLLSIYRIFIYLFVKDWNKTLLFAASNGDLDLLHESLRQKGNMETRQLPDQMTPLMIAAFHNKSAIVSALIVKGASLNSRNEEGSTALMEAVRGGFLDIVQMLLLEGCDIGQMSFNGETALIIAACKSFICI